MKLIFVGIFIETLELARRLKFLVLGYSDDLKGNKEGERYGVRFLGDDNLIIANREEFGLESLVFITPDQPKVRKRLFNKYSAGGFRFANLTSDRANISESATIAKSSSTMIQDLVNISANVEIGKCVRINTGANIMHDCKLGDFVTIAPNAVLLGGVLVGDEAYIGANATLLPGVSIGSGAIVGAGAVVTKNVQPGSTVVGVPAVILKK